MVEAKNPTLLNVNYIEANKDTGVDEHFEVVYRDGNGEMKYVKEPPMVKIYFTKPEFRDHTYNKPHEKMSRLYPVEVPFSKVRKTIEDEMGEEGHRFVRQCIHNKDYKALDKLYLWPYSYRADFHPEFYYMDEWFKKYPTDDSVKPKLTKSYLDIETDQIDGITNIDDIPHSSNEPVNCVTVIMEETMECFTFVLEPYRPKRLGYSEDEYKKRLWYYEQQLKQCRELKANLPAFIKELEGRFNQTYGNLKYHIMFYEKEIELITDIFRTINHYKPNFCMMWNMRFDIQYLLYRIKTLGYNPAEIMCHPDFKHKSCYFKADKFSFAIERQFDYFDCRSYTQYVCQIRTYASIRKSQHALKSVSLNAVADKELEDKKVDYTEETNLVELMYLNFKKFIIYNIKDVLLQLGIEKKTNDMATYYNKAMTNRSPYSKIFRETHFLRNTREYYFNKDGWVQGNNVNIIRLRDANIKTSDPFYVIKTEDEDDDKSSNEMSFKGAINAEPIWNDNVGVTLMGKKSNKIYKNAIDFDMGAFYPSIKIFTNMDPLTLYGKAIFKAPGEDVNEEFISGKMMNRSLNQVYVEKDKNGNMRKNDHTGEAINTFLSGNLLTFGYNWLGLPSVSELYKVVKSKLK